MLHSSFIALFQHINQQLKEQPDHELVMYFDDLERFHCSQCGRCCQRPWSIGVDQTYYQQWSDYWEQHEQERFHGAMRVQPESSFYATLKRHPLTGHCIFLEPDNACYIQRSLGAQAQPMVCQQYPRSWSRPHGSQMTFHLLESCYDAPLLLLGSNHLKWRLQPQETGVAAQDIALDNSHALTPTAYHLWLGWMMDQLLYPVQGCLAALKHVGDGLRALSHSEQSTIQEDNVLVLLQNSSVHALNQQGDKRWQNKIALLLGLPDEWQSQVKSLSLAEQRLLAAFIQGYALRRLIVYGQWHAQLLNMIQTYVCFALCVLIFQFGVLQILWQRPQLLTVELLRDVLNYQEPKLFHHQGWLDHMGLMQWNASTGLEEAQHMMGFDLTQGS